MMSITDGNYYDRAHVIEDVQPNGPGNPWIPIGCVTGDAINAPMRTLARQECPDPAHAGGFLFIGNIPGAKGNVTTTFHIDRGKVDALKGLRLCPFGYRRRYICTGRPDDIHNWEGIDQLCRVQITSIGRSNGGVKSSDANTERVEIPVAIEGGELIEFIQRLAAERVAADLVGRDINHVDFCDWPSCGECNDLPSDGCERWHGVTDSGPGMYDAPYFITYDGRQADPANQWRLDAIDCFGAGEDATDFVCIGDQIVVVSPQGGFGYSPDRGLTWYAVAGMEAAHGPNALYASGREVWACGAGGHIYYSEDAGISWVVQDEGTVTDDLNDISGWGLEMIMAVGENGAIVRTRNAGRSWHQVADPTGGDGLYSVVSPRGNQVDMGTDVGELWHSIDYGESWVQVAIATGGTGHILEIVYCGPCNEGEFGYLVWQPPGAVHGEVFRSIDGGATWQMIEDMPDVGELLTIACCGHSLGVAAGAIHDGFGAIIELESEV